MKKKSHLLFAGENAAKGRSAGARLKMPSQGLCLFCLFCLFRRLPVNQVGYSAAATCGWAGGPRGQSGQSVGPALAEWRPVVGSLPGAAGLLWTGRRVQRVLPQARAPGFAGSRSLSTFATGWSTCPWGPFPWDLCLGLRFCALFQVCFWMPCFCDFVLFSTTTGVKAICTLVYILTTSSLVISTYNVLIRV